ncbi:MAG TPA: D-alanyl-D-alanine carboxypeptidase family protein [Candidatus Binatia bacterium]|nr:D-alanyl-D-alanine carboxypeptidase family protein [Candidatus Binatia bacterium]
MRWMTALAAVLGVSCVTAHARPATTPAVAFVVMDADSGTILAEREAHKRWPPASMAKMMTVLVAMERVRDRQHTLDEPVRASAWASRIGGSQVYLAEGEAFPLGEMLKAVMIASANDAAVAVAEHIAGSTDAFADLMNERAKALGLAETTYQSVHGLPPGKGQTADLTSAHDLAVLGRELMRFPEVMRWAGTASAGFRNDTLQMANTNHLVRTYNGATGLKTGYYREAGFSVTATAARNDLNLITVVLGLPTKKECFVEAARLMNESFATYRVVAPAKRGAPVGQIPVAGANGETIDALAVDDLRVLVKRGEDKGIAVEARYPRLLQAPVRQRQALGDVVVRRGDQELARVAVVADRDVAATGWLSWLWNRGVSSSATR